MEIPRQIEILKTLCVHSRFVAFITPHINGGEDDESDFAVELIRQMNRKPHGFPSSIIEIHTEGPRNARPGDPAFNNYISAIIKKMKRDLGPGFEFTLVIWPHFIDRLLIAGDLSEDTASNSVKKARWAISMNHVARKADTNKSLPNTEWKLLKNDRVSYWTRRYCSRQLSGFLSSNVVST